jgi:hypothetical protein
VEEDAMTLAEAPVRRPASMRRVGYVLAGFINLGILIAINVTPGWAALPFLTPDTELVLPLVNLSLVVGVLANVAYAAYDPAWVRSLGDLVSALVGIAAMARVWAVFPFDFGAYSFDWGLLTRFVLAIAIAGSLIGVIAGSVNLLRALVERGSRPRW